MRNRQSKITVKTWLLCATAAVQAITAAPKLFGSTWLGGSDWNTAANWSPTGIPNSAATPVIFTETGAGTVNISSSVSAQSLTFTNTTASYTLTSSANQTLTLQSGNLTESAATVSINLANVASGSLLFGAASTAIPLTLTNNSTSGILIIGTSTVIGSSGLGGVIVQGIESTTFAGSFATVNTSTAVVGGLTKNGPGSFNYSGSGTNLKGNLTLNGGTTIFNYNLSLDSKLFTGGGASGALFLSGADLQINSPSANVQTIPGGVTVNAGQSTIESANGNAPTLVANAISHTTGGTIDLAVNVAFAVTTTTGTTNSLLGAFATTGNGTTWATLSGNSIVGLTTYGTNVYTSGVNTDVTSSASIGSMLTNSLRFNTGNLTLTLSGTNTLQSGGILITPSASGATITGGTLTASGGGEIIFNDYTSGNVTVNSALSSSGGLTKGGFGNLILTGNNTALTGPININRGNLTVTNIAAISSASALNFNDNRQGINLQDFNVDLGNGNSGTIPASIRLSVAGTFDYGTYFISGFNTNNSTITLSGVISSNPNTTNTSIRFTSAFADTSGFNLTNPANTFTGNISLSHGFLGITADGSLGNAANTLIIEENDSAAGGLIFLNTGILMSHPVSISSIARIVVNGTDGDTIIPALTGTGSLVKDGTGTLALASVSTLAGDTTIAAGTLILTTSGGLSQGKNLTINSNATFIPNTGIGAFQHIGTLNLSGTVQVVLGSSNLLINQLVTGPSGGTIDLSGGNTYTVKMESANAAIFINSNSTWLSNANNSTLTNIAPNIVPINILPGVTLTNGIALTQSFFGFDITGGGTLYQNSDTTNELNMNASITVTKGTLRLTDVSSNSGIGNFGTGLISLDGGTFSYGGATSSTIKPLFLTANGGTIAVELASTNLTLSNPITGVSSLTKSGPGTLTLNSSSNNFSSLTINAGTVATNSDSNLSTAPVTINSGATLLYTSSAATPRTFTLSGGTLQAASGTTLNLVGATVNGGFLRGAFILNAGTTLTGVTTFSNTTITQNGTSTLSNFTNGGTLNNNSSLTFSDGINNFTGTINVSGTMSVQDFGSTGIININPGATLTNSGSNLVLGGGSRTFIGTKVTPGGNLTLTGGTTLEVNGALLVNDGTITGTTDVNFGGQAQGIGTYGIVNISFGGVYQPGFASASVPGNGSLVLGLSGNGTIDNTSTGNMTLTLAGSGSSTFSGPIQNSTGNTALAITGTSSLTLLTTPLPAGGNSANTYSGGTSIAPGGTLLIGATGALPAGFPVANNGSFLINANSTSGQITGLGALSIGANATLHLAHNAPVSETASLALSTNSFLDLDNVKLIVEDTSASRATDLATLRTEAPNHSLFSATANAINIADGRIDQVIVVSDNGFRLGAFGATASNFGGGTNNVDANSILVTTAYLGDANLDGVVDIKDLQDLANHWQQPAQDWTQADFDGNGVVALQDLQALANHWQAGVGAGGGSGGGEQSFSDALALVQQFAASPVPEPASLALILTLLPPLLTRRRRQN